MRASGIRHTTTTGGTGTLTLTRETGFLSWVDIFGSSGTRFVEYCVEEAASNKREWGIGNIALSTGVLTRTQIVATQSGTTYDATTPGAISFGTTGVTVSCRPLGELSPLRMPFFPTASPSEDLGYCVNGLGNTALNHSITNARAYYIIGYWPGGYFSQVGFYVTSGATGGACKWAIYEIGSDGLPGQRIYNTGSNIAMTSSGAKVETGTFFLPAGVYYFGAIFTTSSGSITVKGAQSPQLAHMGTSSGTPLLGGYVAGTYASGLPDPASTSLTALAANTTAQVPLVFLKPSNT